jgi:UDP-3-O-[3-hydroxymyristoyl] glucosamine N-acyltransferase
MFCFVKSNMDNPFFKNNGPFKFRDILKELNLENNENNQDLNIIDIKDLQNSKFK